MQANPFLGNGMTAKLLDPGRVPQGAAALWPQLQELPYTPRCDSAGELDTRHGWTTALAEGYANRVLDRISGHAPDLRRKIRMIDVLTPHDLEARNPNAFNGDPYGGSTELDQNLLWRPLASLGRHATPVDRLWHIGASTHPGPGLNGGSGHLVAATLIRNARCAANK
jgi:phytoene dehydrogenase-like protein